MTQPVTFAEPARRAWERMTGLLFRPAQLRTWLVVGFTAWLAELGARGGQSGYNVSSDDLDLEELGRGGDLWRGLAEGGFWVALGPR